MTNPPPTEEPDSAEPDSEQPERKRPKYKYSKLYLRHQAVDHVSRDPNDVSVWPHRRLQNRAPATVYLLRAISRRLTDHKLNNGWSLRDIESLTHVNASSVSRLLHGETWGSVPIIAQLERELDIDLWGDEHRKR